jgi:signal transduction histidine kinase
MNLAIGQETPVSIQAGTMNLAMDQVGSILIVDDNPANLGVLSDTLDQVGLEVWVAQSGKIALERVKYAQPDLILLDVMMPEIDGFETCRRLKANLETKDIPVIFMTALSDTENKVQGFQLGAVDYITKPFQQEEALARIKLHLKLSDLTEKLEEKNALLEQKVTEVGKAYSNLQQAQAQLVQTEKMSSLGQLVAGVAHEINNPVNFIYGNLNPAAEYTRDLLNLVQLYQQHYPQPLPAIQTEATAIDLDFLKEDLPRLLSSMKLGADRIKTIVSALQNFSRMDEAEVKAVNLHDGIDSTLMILQSRLKETAGHSGIRVTKEYGDLPLIQCYAGQLNQVFMNILSNAIDALDDYNQQRSLEEQQQSPAEITIQTKLIGDYLNGESASPCVQIRIADNGPGMTEQVRQRLFEPFFTTKPVGKGTGLGLAISYQVVVDKHGGNLSCLSTLGEGTAFLIELGVVCITSQKDTSSK